MEKYYVQTSDEVFSSLETGGTGLSQTEAEKRFAENGANELDSAKKRSTFLKFLDQFKDVMIIVLLVAAAVSATISIVQGEYSELIDSGLILLIVIVNAIIGLVQENKAEEALEALKTQNKPHSKVIRDGILQTVDSRELVTGDLVVLEAGDLVPADLRLVETASLKVEEAALTGESVPSEKNSVATLPEDAPLGDRVNMAYSSGVVAYGRGRGIVTATGMDTEVGKIAKMLAENDNDKTPLQLQLAKTAKYLSVLVLAIAAVIFVFSAITGGKEAVLDAFMTAVAIAVAAIPEGLPAVVTIVLAIGVQRMSQRNAIIRNLPSVETLGCCEVICSDKTGTLTQNKMTVRQLYTPMNTLLMDGTAEIPHDDEGFSYLVKGMVLCNDTIIGENKLSGDPTETALVACAMTLGRDALFMQGDSARVREIPFDSERKLMSTVNETEEGEIAFVKGAPDMLLARCSRVLRGTEMLPMTEEFREEIARANGDMADKALRVLAVAIKKEGTDDLDNLEQNLIFVGLAGMIDPARPEVSDAVAVCKQAGMRAVMITGDHPATAAAIAREIGILYDDYEVMTGAEIDAMSDEDFAAKIDKVRVFARVSPENKVRIVKAFRAKNLVTAMTGDGVNDAPSLKAADIGIGMGITGTDVSKGASDMVLADDNFATIVSAVEEGRKVYSNIKKAVQFLLSANIAEVLCLFIATIFLRVPFLTPVMILWINLVTDSLPALALGVEEAEPDIMRYKPRRSGTSLFHGRTGLDILVQGALQTGLVMAAFCIGNYVLSDGVSNHSVAMTMAFVTLCFIQLFHAYNMRSQNNSILTKKFFKNKFMNLSFLVGGALVCLVVLVPFMNTAFDTAWLNAGEWGISIALAFAVIPLVEIQKVVEKAILKRRGKDF